MKLNSQNKTGTKLKILLAQIKAGNNSNNMKKKKNRQTLYFFYQHSKITKKR